MNSFKVGDRVKTEIGLGEIVLINSDMILPYLVKHDKWKNGHNGNSIGHSDELNLKGNHCFWLYKEDLEPVKSKRPRIVITTNGQEVMAYGYFDGEKKKASAKCNPSDTFDFEVGTKLALERLFDKGVKEEPKLYNAKVVCVKNFEGFTTLGKIYEIKDGRIRFDNQPLCQVIHTNLVDLNKRCCSKFIEVVE